MSCIDPVQAARLLAGGEDTAEAWLEHREACETCRHLEERAAELAAGDGAAVHPSGAALVAYDERPEELDPGTRRWLAAHLAECRLCREALDAVPPEAPPAAAPWRIGRVLALAAALLFGFVLVLQVADHDKEDRVVQEGPTRPDGSTVVLENTRGGERPQVPADAGLVLFEPVLGEAVELGDAITLIVMDASGAETHRQAMKIASLNEDWGRPILPVRHALLPAGPLTIRLILPSGHEVTFACEVR